MREATMTTSCHFVSWAVKCCFTSSLSSNGVGNFSTLQLVAFEGCSVRLLTKKKCKLHLYEVLGHMQVGHSTDKGLIRPCCTFMVCIRAKNNHQSKYQITRRQAIDEWLKVVKFISRCPETISGWKVQMLGVILFKLSWGFGFRGLFLLFPAVEFWTIHEDLPKKYMRRFGELFPITELN